MLSVCDYHGSVSRELLLYLSPFIFIQSHQTWEYSFYKHNGFPFVFVACSFYDLLFYMVSKCYIHFLASSRLTLFHPLSSWDEHAQKSHVLLYLWRYTYQNQVMSACIISKNHFFLRNLRILSLFHVICSSIWLV